MKKNFIKIISFVLLFTLTITGTLHALDFKYLDSTFKLDAFYDLPENSVDVLVLGSSHAYQGINTAVMWNEYGYAAFDLCGAAQPIWNTYYYLEEALKTQTPKVIILDVYTLHYSGEYGETSFAIKNTYGLKWSDTKKEAIEVSFDHTDTGIQYYLDVLQYHSRYSDLNKTDFYPYQANRAMYENHKGFYCYFRSEAVNEPDLTGVNYINEMSDKSMFYYKMILELAQSKNIPVIVTAIPFAAEPFHQGFFNQAEAVANDYGVPFYNFLTEYKEAVGIDYKTDFADNQHLNYLGNTKLTRFIANRLKENYNIPDNRGNEKYVSWDKDAEVYYNQLENHNNSLIARAADYAPVFSNDRYTVIMTLSCHNYAEIPSNSKIIANRILSSAGIKTAPYDGGVWILRNGEIDSYKHSPDEGFSKAVSLGKSDGALIKSEPFYDEDGTKYIFNRIYFNKQLKSKTDYGLNIFVYDEFTQSLTDVVCVDFKDSTFKR